jgi:type IV pilus biogenesis protein CpaD/CtpE
VSGAYAIFNNCYQNFGIVNATTMAAMLSKPSDIQKEPECRGETRETSERSFRWLERWNMS